jgi:hypothetical protein
MLRTAQIVPSLAVCVLISAAVRAGPTAVTGGFAAGTSTSRPFQIYGDGLVLSGNSGDANLGPLESCSPCTNRSSVWFSSRFGDSRIGPPGTFNGIHYDQVYLGGSMAISAPQVNAAALSPEHLTLTVPFTMTASVWGYPTGSDAFNGTNPLFSGELSGSGIATAHFSACCMYQGDQLFDFADVTYRFMGATAADFDGDRQADMTVFRPSTGRWFTLNSRADYTTGGGASWGLNSDTPVPGDYDGDGRADPAVYRPSTGQWFILQSTTNYTTSVVVPWGVSTDVPVPGDYDGDGKVDPAVYRPSTGQWFVLKSSTNYTTSMVISWGLSTDIPVPGDYDGDGKVDPAVYQPSTGQWRILQSTTNYTTSVVVPWGVSTDVPVPGDYDGDGKVDPAVYRPSTGQWFVLESTTNYTTGVGVAWGVSTDVTVPGDYDGDGKVDPAVYRPSTGQWFVLKSTTDYTTSVVARWGLATDTPTNKLP